MPRRVEILRSGKQFRFVFVSDNDSDKLDPRDTYHNKQDLKDMLQKYFPGFPIVDRTAKTPPKVRRDELGNKE